MNSEQVIRKVAKAYEQITAEDRITVMHGLKDDYGTWDVSPPVSFALGQKPSDVVQGFAFKQIAKLIDGVVFATDTWAYPKHIREQFDLLPDEMKTAYWAAHPPSSCPDRVSCSLYLLVTKKGEQWMGFQTRDGELLLSNEPNEMEGIQLDAIKAALDVAR